MLLVDSHCHLDRLSYGSKQTDMADVLAKAAKLAPQVYLDQHTSYDYFKHLDRLLMTGPTMTNVNDLRIILIGKP